jgi:4-alpha-glucanotransferase
MESQRQSGILLHPTSLPGPYGIGSFNQAAYDWVDFLWSAGQTLWQMLPLGPTGYGDSPYQSFSSFAGNPYLISLEALVEDGLLAADVLKHLPDFSAERVDYGRLYHWKPAILRQAAAAFARQATTEQRRAFEQFCTTQGAWLEDFALFMALKDAHHGTPWYEWHTALRSRQPEALQSAAEHHASTVYAYKFTQWLFFTQWQRLKQYANARHIRIIGDLPIFVAMDSADVWTNPGEFCLDEALQPTVVAGVPPDYFSATGQLWGNPLYRWEVMQRNGYAWWLRRMRAALQMSDVVRIDHFRGFSGYWEVPADAQTAASGRWVKGPGADFFHAVLQACGTLPIIAEDLGDITPDVITLREQFHLPGMKVLQFAFSTDAQNVYLPHHYTQNFVVYTGTHDNNTTAGWYDEKATPQERAYFCRYLRTTGCEAAWSLIELAWGSVARMAVAPLQDVLSLGSEARMNLPGSAHGNWTWRFRTAQLTDTTQERLRDTTCIYGRAPAHVGDLAAVVKNAWSPTPYPSVL